MEASNNIKLPYIAAAQAQKHITHNEAIRMLDVLVQTSVISRNLTIAPTSPMEGDHYIIASGATGIWAGKDQAISAYQDNDWQFYTPQEGWQIYSATEGSRYIFNGSIWQVISGDSLVGAITDVNIGINGALTQFQISEEEIVLSGAYTDSAIVIPDRAIVFAVTTRTTQAITGATSYDCGVAGDVGKYGGVLGISLGSTNDGVTGPTAYYSDTNIKITANGSSFLAGKVRVAIHYMLCTAPTS